MDVEIIDLGMELGHPLHIEMPEGITSFKLQTGAAPVTVNLKDARVHEHVRQLRQEKACLAARLVEAGESLRREQRETAIAHADQARAEESKAAIAENCRGLAQQRDEATREVTELRTILRDIRAALGVKDGDDAVATARALYENLGAMQKRCSELLDECRGWRRMPAVGGEDAGDKALGRVIGSVVAERFRQDAKWGRVGPNHLDRPDFHENMFGLWGFSRKQTSDFCRAACDLAAAEGRLTWEHILDEEWFEACAETEPEKLRAELIQVAAVACSWVQAIDMREELARLRREVEATSQRTATTLLERFAASRRGASA